MREGAGERESGKKRERSGEDERGRGRQEGERVEEKGG